MHHSSHLVSIAALLLVSGCARPDAVRVTANSAVPVASMFRAALPMLEKRLAVQLNALELDRAGPATMTDANKLTLARVQAEMALAADADARTKRLAILTGDGDAVRADPLAALHTAARPQLPQNAIPTEEVDRMIAGLSAMAEAKPWSFGEMLSFAKAVRQENQRIAKESSSEN